jgi:hypothetical protein
MATESIKHVDFHTVPFTPGNAKLGTTSRDGKVLMQTWSRPYGLTCPDTDTDNPCALLQRDNARRGDTAGYVVLHADNTRRIDGDTLTWPTEDDALAYIEHEHICRATCGQHATLGATVHPVETVQRKPHKDCEPKEFGDTWTNAGFCPACTWEVLNGCYANPTDKTAFRMAQTNKGAHRRLDMTPPIYQLAPDTGAFHHVLRLHVVGDLLRHGKPDTGYINAIKRQVDQYVTAHGVKPTVFSFTHAWKHPVVARLRKYVSLIASCDTLADVGLAVRRNWFVSWHSPDIDMSQTYTDTQHGRLFNCANQRHGTKCSDCRVCWRLPARKLNGATLQRRLRQSHGIDCLPVVGVAFLTHK